MVCNCNFRPQSMVVIFDTFHTRQIHKPNAQFHTTLSFVCISPFHSSEMRSSCLVRPVWSGPNERSSKAKTSANITGQQARMIQFRAESTLYLRYAKYVSIFMTSAKGMWNRKFATTHWHRICWPQWWECETSNKTLCRKRFREKCVYIWAHIRFEIVCRLGRHHIYRGQ